MKIKCSALLCVLTWFLCTAPAAAQCTSTTITGDYIVSSSIILSGTYTVSGRFVIPAGVTVFVGKYSATGCGKLEINAASVIIQGTVNADDAGYTGGLGGAGGVNVTSLTGDIVSLTGCSNKDNTGQVTIEGGKQGTTGNGPGAGTAGVDGQSGSGPKQQCLTTNDEAGMIGTGGGAGGGGGGSYGGSAGNADKGGNGTNAYTSSGVNVSPAFAIVAGNGGNGGSAGTTYGTAAASDIEPGSGGGGGGGGARSFITGGNGGKGGNGGGMIKIVATDTLILSGTLSCNGSNGANGGIGGDGGATAKCCSDGCDDCGESNLSCGAGAGSGAGGGSGGGIYLESGAYMDITGSLNAKGGTGGYGGGKGYGVSCTYSATFCGSQTLTSGDGNDGSSGGGGGGGRIKIFAGSCATNIINPVTAVNGGSGFGNGAAGTYNLICNTASVEENTAYHRLSIYPNPGTSTVTVQFRYPQFLNDSHAEFRIYDLHSRLVQTDKCELGHAGEQQIGIESLQPGIYLLRLISNEVTVTEKLIKQ